MGGLGGGLQMPQSQHSRRKRRNVRKKEKRKLNTNFEPSAGLSVESGGFEGGGACRVNI